MQRKELIVMKNKKVFAITSIALMSALVFVSSQFSINIPLAVGNTRLHMGNVFCLLSGLILGPIGGGLAAGIGSFLFDLSNPLYISSAPFTFVFKFLLAWVCGLVAYSRGKDGLSIRFNLLGGVLGSLTYMVLYLTKGFLENLLFLSTEAETALIMTAQKAAVSGINAVIAVVVAIPLGVALRKALDTSHLKPRL